MNNPNPTQREMPAHVQQHDAITRDQWRAKYRGSLDHLHDIQWPRNPDRLQAP